MTKVAASCRLDQLEGSSCSVAGVETRGVGTGGNPARPEEAVGVETDRVVEVEEDALVEAVLRFAGRAVATGSGCWSDPNKRAAPAPAMTATASATRNSAANPRRPNLKPEGGSRFIRGQQLAPEGVRV